MRIRSLRWAVLALILTASISSFAGVFLSVSFGPPALPVYVQPPCPAAGYIWTPGYWAYGPNGYFWVPGTWVLAPEPGLLWTPGYWGWGGAAFLWHAGYWGPRVGFYGGINYGFGYFGAGYQGGYWRDRQFFYNRNVNNVESIHVTNVYNTTVVNNQNHVSFNGGRGGLQARPTSAEEQIARQKHFAPTTLQTRHETAAASNRQLWASENHGRPAIAATAKPAVFKGKGVVAAREAGAPYKPSAERGTEQPKANNAVPRPGNNPARPATAERGATPAHHDVPRPPQTAGKSAPARAETASRQAATPARSEVPRPPQTASRGSSPRIENTSRPASVPRPTNTARENTSRSNNVTRPQAANRGESPRTETNSRAAAPRSSAVSRPQSAPRPEAQSRPASRSNERPAEKPREDGHSKGRG